MGIFGWSYPAGCSGPPDDYYCEPEQPRCICGSYLSYTPAGHHFKDVQETEYEPKKDFDRKLEREKETGRKWIDGWEVCKSPWEDGTPWVKYWFTWKLRIDEYPCKRCGHVNEFSEM